MVGFKLGSVSFLFSLIFSILYIACLIVFVAELRSQTSFLMTLPSCTTLNCCRASLIYLIVTKSVTVNSFFHVNSSSMDFHDSIC